MDLSRLLHCQPPWLHLLPATESETRDVIRSLQKSSGKIIVFRTIHGDKAKTKAALFDEFAVALLFPDYFGKNWDALEECLADLQWLPGDAYVFQITKAVHLLENRSPEDQKTLFQLLDRIGQEWSQTATGERKRPPKRFPCPTALCRRRLDIARTARFGQGQL